DQTRRIANPAGDDPVSGSWVRWRGSHRLAMAACSLEGASNVLDAERLDDHAHAHILVVLEGHAAFLAAGHFGDFVLEALERLELAFVDDDVVADEAYACATFDLAFSNAAACHLADLGDVEHLKDLGITKERLAAFWRQKAGHRCFDIIDEVIDDVVVANFD